MNENTLKLITENIKGKLVKYHRDHHIKYRKDA